MTAPKKAIEFTQPTQDEIDFYIKEGLKMRSDMFHYTAVSCAAFFRKCLVQFVNGVNHGIHRTGEIMHGTPKATPTSGLIHD